MVLVDSNLITYCQGITMHGQLAVGRPMMRLWSPGGWRMSWPVMFMWMLALVATTFCLDWSGTLANNLKYFPMFGIFMFQWLSPNMFCSQEDHHSDFLEVLRWTLKHTSIYFRSIHKSGVWMDLDVAKQASESGWLMTVTKLSIIQVFLNSLQYVCKSNTPWMVHGITKIQKQRAYLSHELRKATVLWLNFLLKLDGGCFACDPKCASNNTLWVLDRSCKFISIIFLEPSWVWDSKE